MGGTRFVGKALVNQLLAKGYDLSLFTRGNRSIPKNVEHIIGDRNNLMSLEALSGRKFDFIIDTSGRNLDQTKNVIKFTGKPKKRFIYLSSAGVYKRSDILPIDEKTEVDLQSRHIGKYETEQWLANNEISFTSIRPTYIYGPGNYNPIEKWFFDRLLNKRIIPIPGNGDTVTQLGHVYDLANAMILCIENETSINKIYNCSGEKGITFNGLVKLAAKACGIYDSDIKICKYEPQSIDTKSRKLFPLRLEPFFTDVLSLKNDLNWLPKYDLLNGFIDSYTNDYLNRADKSVDFDDDDTIIRQINN
tara:strand:- start:8325 stop:9239 length:915 start_codon:yes stop_codon:yes gene_type:complete